MKIGVLTSRESWSASRPILSEAVQLLAQWGVSVDLIYLEETVTDLAQVGAEHDLYVLKSGAELALSLAGALHAAGAAILNPFPVAAITRDKIAGTRFLQAAGLPVPDTYVTSHPRQLAPLLDRGPLIVKPYRGSQGRGIRVVWDRRELDAIRGDDGPVFAQRYHQPDGCDRKIYCIGGQLFGVLRPWPATTYEAKVGVPFTITPELRQLALRCGRAFGIDLYGVDVIESNGQWYLVDFSSFPGFKGVPDAALRLADYIYAAGRRLMNGEPLLPSTAKEVLA